MSEKEFIRHACEQVLRFTNICQWDDLSEERKVQLGFNLGVMALGLNLAKKESFAVLNGVRQGTISTTDFRDHMQKIIAFHKIEIDEAQIIRPI